MTTRFFTSWVRRGAASAILEIDSANGAFAGPATFQPAITFSKDGTAQPPTPGPELTILGPGAVVGLDKRHVVRTDPAHGATSVEDNFLAVVEFARPDLPWLFTPASPNAASRLRPWLVLVVVDASRTVLQPGNPLPRITVSDTELPDLNDSWAWAHAQATTDDDADPNAPANALIPPSDGNAVSRLICPRRLQPDTHYLACVVPSTLVGVQAGLGQPLAAGPALVQAWVAGAGQDVVLPVYYSWTFSTGAAGDFKSLVLRLQGIPPDSIAGFGTRAIDMSSPWESDPQVGAGATLSLDGAISVGGNLPTGNSFNIPGNLTDGQISDFQSRLEGLLDFPADLQPTNPTNDPTLSAVAPPIYAGRHAGQVRVPGAAGWLRTLNLDPRRRIAAAFGVRYVQDHQEFLMARAWDQLGAVKEANRLRAQAELAAEVADRLYARHVQTMGQPELFSFAAPARSRVLVAADQTFKARVATTGVPAGATTVAFTRMARPLGPLGNRVFNGAPSGLVVKGLTNALQVAAPPAELDGLGQTLAAGPPAQLVTGDATGFRFSQAWQGITATEKTLPPTIGIKQLPTMVRNPSQGLGLVKGTPVVIAFPPAPVADNATVLSGILSQALQPSIGILKRLDGRLQVPISLGGGNTTTPVMACPHFTAPLALALLKEHREYLLPGLGKFPADRVTLMQANSEFVEAFLAGANHEMNRELLWREYPTDQRGTPFQYFWPRPDGQADIPPITDWPLSNALGTNGAAVGPDVEKMLVLLVRGEVLRRFPRTLVYAAPGMVVNNQLALNTGVDWTAPLFLIKLDSQTTAFAYNLTEDDVHSDLTTSPPKAGWYFVFSEPVTGPRFNFDEPDEQKSFSEWNDLKWSQVPMANGFAIAGEDLSPPPNNIDPPASWNRDAADTARIAFARPFRIAYHADELLAGGA